MKNLRLVLGLVAAMVTFAGCSDDDGNDVNGGEEPTVAVESVEITPQEWTLVKGSVKTLTAYIYPQEAQDQTVNWSSDDESIASVDAEGTITAIAAGNTKIRAEVGGKHGTCDIRVDAIKLNYNNAEVTVREWLILTAGILAENPEDYNYIVWSSSDETVATVDKDGWVQALAPGNVVITASAGVISEECHMTVSAYAAPEGVGDFFYSDGTRSATLAPGKTPIGVVFWVGDPTQGDPTLKNEHPDCTHGLVVALNQFKLPYFVDKQTSDTFTESTGFTAIGLWIEAHLAQNSKPYQSICETHPYQIRGYNNTQALLDFNAAPGNTEWPLSPIAQLEQYRLSTPAPAGTSGWYMPSVKELSLLCMGDYDGELESNFLNNNNALLINSILKQITEAETLTTTGAGGTGVYWSSSDVFLSHTRAHQMGRINMNYGNIGNDHNHRPNPVRYILAY